MNIRIRTCFIVLLTLALAACTPSLPRYRLHHSMVSQPPAQQPPRTIVLLPVDVTVKQLSAGGVTEEVGPWTRQAKKVIRKVLNDYADTEKKFSIVRLPKLSAKQKRVVDEHVALYNRVGYAALFIPPGEAWKHKRKRFDYTLGPGLRFLRKKTGADAALIFIGADVVSTSGRKAMAILAGVSLGYSRIVIGVVDLRTGNILWMNHTRSEALGFRKQEDVKKMVKDVMSQYPGIKIYREAITGK